MLDLKNKKGMEIFLKLIDNSDVFLNNMSIEAPKKLGIGPDDLLARNPRLIYAQASRWGRKGPDAHQLSLDYTGIARSGFMMSCGERGAPPTQILPGIGDEIGGMMCAWGGDCRPVCPGEGWERAGGRYVPDGQRDCYARIYHGGPGNIGPGIPLGFQ